MASKTSVTTKTVDDMLKAMLVFARAVDHVLETRAVENATALPLSSSKVQVLRLLGRQGAQTSTRVARFLGVSKPAVSQIIDAMVRGKLVARKTASDDRREIHLQLTKQGKTVLDSILRHQRQGLRDALRNARGIRAGKAAEMLIELTNGLVVADREFQDFCLQCAAHADSTCMLADGEARCAYFKHERTESKSSGSSAKSPKRSYARTAAWRARRGPKRSR